MFKVKLECGIVAEDQDTGYWRRKLVTGRSIYSFQIALLSALEEIHHEASSYAKMKEIEEMENDSDLPF
jgi:hypothetical protein